MTRKRTALAAAVVLGLALVFPASSQAQWSTPGELVAGLIEKVLARWVALWQGDRLPVRKQCEAGTSSDPNGCPAAMSPPSGDATREAGQSSDPDG